MLGATQIWAQGDEWDQMDWEGELALNEAMALVEALEQSDEPAGRVADVPAAGSPAVVAAVAGPAETAPIAELAAESLLNLHSTPVRPSPVKRALDEALVPTSTRMRPAPTRRATLGSSSSTAIPSGPSSTSISASMSMSMNMSMDLGMGLTNHYPGWPVPMLDTPISLRPSVQRTQGQGNANNQPVIKGCKDAGDRSLSFSAAVLLDDPFEFELSPGGDFRSGLDDKENARATRQAQGGGRGAEPTWQNGPVIRLGRDQGGSPIPTSHRRRQPLTSILSANSHAALSVTLLGPSPEKKAAHSTIGMTPATFATPTAAGRRSTTAATALCTSTKIDTSAHRTPRPGVSGKAPKRGWALSSPAVQGIAAELGLVGQFAYIAGLETPGAVMSETPARDRS